MHHLVSMRLVSFSYIKSSDTRMIYSCNDILYQPWVCKLLFFSNEEAKKRHTRFINFELSFLRSSSNGFQYFVRIHSQPWFRKVFRKYGKILINILASHEYRIIFLKVLNLFIFFHTSRRVNFSHISHVFHFYGINGTKMTAFYNASNNDSSIINLF